MQKIKYAVTIIKKETKELVDVVFMECASEKGCFKLLRNDFKNCEFHVKEIELKNKESLLKRSW